MVRVAGQAPAATPAATAYAAQGLVSLAGGVLAVIAGTMTGRTRFAPFGAGFMVLTLTCLAVVSVLALLRRGRVKAGLPPHIGVLAPHVVFAQTVRKTTPTLAVLIILTALSTDGSMFAGAAVAGGILALLAAAYTRWEDGWRDQRTVLMRDGRKLKAYHTAPASPYQQL